METVYNELDEIRRKIAEELAQEQYKRENRRGDLLNDTINKLSKGNPVTITTEMRELGLEFAIGVAAYNHSLNQRILSKMDEDDYFDADDFSDVL